MTAFGPYKDVEIIDFRELEGNKLFVISGNTGAGKTTIFDAICFALYGTASGEDRNEAKNLRSDFADDDVYTSVELEFELRKRSYRIKRQLPHVKKGNKTATGDTYEFYEIKGEQEVPCVDRQIVSEINKKVEELVGLTKDQFIQIVMLPQGEFRKLLTSQTENKEEILRKIFKTERYTLISQRLKEKKQLAEEAYKIEKNARDRYIVDIGATLPTREGSKLFETLSQENYNSFQVLTGLEEEALFYEKTIEDNKKKEESAETAYHHKLEEFHKAESINKEFQSLEEKETHLNELANEKASFKEKEIKLENAERASRIESIEIQVNDWRKDVTEKEENVETAKTSYDQSVRQLKDAETNFEAEENRSEEREKVGKQLDKYHELLPLVQELDQKETELENGRQNLEKIAKELEGIQNNKQGQKDAISKLNLDIKEIEKNVDELPSKQQKLIELRDQGKVLLDYLEYHEKQVQLEQKTNERKAEFLTLKEQYEALESAWINGQATILAAHLHDGKPCPVCGSEEHPNKAQGHETVPTKEELEAAKQAFNEKDNDYREIAAQYKTNKEQLETKKVEVIALGVSEEEAPNAYEQMVTEEKALKSEVDSLNKEKEKLAGLKRDLEEKQSDLEQVEKQYEEKSNEYQKQNTAFQADRAVYSVQLERIPEELRELTVLEEEIRELKAVKDALAKAWETAQERLQTAKNEETRAKTNLENATLQLRENRTKKEKVEQQFIDALQQAQFSDEDSYRQAKMTDDVRKQLKAEIDFYHQQVATFTQQIKELKESLQDKNKIDLEALQAELVGLKEDHERAQEGLRQCQQHLQTVLTSKEKISKANDNVTQLENRLNVVTDLHDVIRGQNHRKISFERYLQIEFLEQIIVAANERLKRLSNGQFLLQRSERQEARGKQSGLGLDVYDSYTGQTRDVKTLSGGEKFNASLSLALGMADVIQSFQGGVSIDTMFIDEGFGSLDEESLAKAIDTLIDLQKSGRMIGIISHVQELKNAIPAVLEVTKMKEGYSKSEFVIK